MSVLSRRKLPAKLEYLQEFMLAVSACAKEQNFSRKKIYEIELATEEALVNIFNYSYPEGNGEAEIICNLEGDTFIVEIIDYGIPFDITTVPDPDVTVDISQRALGGLGIFFIKKLMDDVQYRRENDKNILSLIIKKELSW
jgi:anti-sigma regulatory factor (Ser/Thr protein kinase)